MSQITTSAKEVMFLVEMVCLFVCMLATLLKKLWTGVYEISKMARQGYKEQPIKVWYPEYQLEIRPLLNKLWAYLINFQDSFAMMQGTMGFFFWVT